MHETCKCQKHTHHYFKIIRMICLFKDWLLFFQLKERERERPMPNLCSLPFFGEWGGGARGKQIRNFMRLWATDTHRCLLVHDTLIHVKIMFYWSTNLELGVGLLCHQDPKQCLVLSLLLYFYLEVSNGLKHDSILVIELNFFQLDSFGRWTPHLFSMVDMRHHVIWNSQFQV